MSGMESPSCGAFGESGTWETDREWVSAHVLRGGAFSFYGALCEQIGEQEPAVFWARVRAIAQRYLRMGAERTAAFHQEVDSLLEQLLRRDERYGYPPPFCHKGCAACCHEVVYCTDEEAAEIARFCAARDVPVDSEKIGRQLRHLEVDAEGNHTGVTTWSDQPESDQACVFLNPADCSCRIWPVRPFVCRVHLAEGTDAHCKPHNGEPDPQAIGIDYPEISYILTTIFTIHRDSIRKSLGSLLLALRRSWP